MNYQINKHQQRGPIGGHHIHTNGRMFRADDFPALVKAVRKYRVDNGVTIGEPEQEILRYYAQKFPWLVLPALDNSQPAVNESYEHWKSWIASTWKKAPTKFVTIKQARERWAACEKCPFNVALSWPESDESAAYQKRAFTLRRGVTVPEGLGFCACHKVDLGVFTFLEAAKDHSHQKEPQPSGCWVGSFAGL